MKIVREALVMTYEATPDRNHSIQGRLVLNVEPGEELPVPLTRDEVEELFPKLRAGTKRVKVTIEIE